MNLEIHKPELVQRVTRAYPYRSVSCDTDEVIEKALDALDEKTPAKTVRPRTRART